MEEVVQIPDVFDDEQQYVGEVYAKALIGAAKAAGVLDVVVDQLSSLIREVLSKNSTFEFALSSPKVSNEQRFELLDRVFSGRIDATLLRFLKVLCRRGRLGFLRSIEQAATRMRDEAAGRLRVTVVTASALSAEQRSNLQSTLSTAFKKEVSIHSEVDPSILGGLVIRVGDTLYDGSVDGKLTQLRKATAQKTEQAIRDRIGTLAS